MRLNTGLGDQNMVIEDVTIETETAGRKKPKTSEILVFSVRPKASQAGRCSRCRKRCPGYDAGGRDGEGTRRWRTLDVGTTKAYLQAAAPRVACEEHGVVVAHVPWARPGAKHTWLFEDTCAWLAAHTALSVLTVLLRIAWRTVAAIVTRVVADGRDTNDLLDGLSRIGIDEIAYRKGHRYLTVIVDHTTGRLVWAGEGRNQDTLGRFFDELGAGRATRLTHVSCDGAEWIRAAMKTRGMKQLSIYPEDRGCAAPTAARILEIFTGLARHHLTDRHGNHVQTFHPHVTELQCADASSCLRPDHGDTPITSQTPKIHTRHTDQTAKLETEASREDIPRAGGLWATRCNTHKGLACGTCQ